MSFRSVFFILCGLATGSLAAHQGAKDPAKTSTGVQAAVQLPGDNGKIGTPYQLGKKDQELVFTLEKAEFASRALLKDRAVFPKEGERLVILTYAVQNPGKSDRMFFDQSFSFTVVSPDDENFVTDGGTSNGVAGLHPDRKEGLNIQLKPAQKVRAIAVIQIHPKGPINKLIVQRHKDTTVLRYDLKEKVKPMKSVFAANEQGFDIQDVGKSMLTIPYDHGTWDVVVEKSEEVPLSIGDFSLEEGEKWVVLTMAFTNAGVAAAQLNQNFITGKMFDVDGSEFPESLNMINNSSGAAFDQTVEPGATVKVRMLYKAPLLSKPTRIVFKEYHSERRVEVKLEKPKEKSSGGSGTLKIR